MAKVASELGLEFSAKVSRQRMGTRGTTLDGLVAAENCLPGMIARHETVIFDRRMFEGGFSRQPKVMDAASVSTTVVGLGVPADSYCRDRGLIEPSRWHVEKLGEWVFVFDEFRPLLKPAKVLASLEEVFQSARIPTGMSQRYWPGA
jgi:hypothetical protein